MLKRNWAFNSWNCTFRNPLHNIRRLHKFKVPILFFYLLPFSLFSFFLRWLNLRKLKRNWAFKSWNWTHRRPLHNIRRQLILHKCKVHIYFVFVLFLFPPTFFKILFLYLNLFIHEVMVFGLESCFVLLWEKNVPIIYNK